MDLRLVKRLSMALATSVALGATSAVTAPVSAQQQPSGRYRVLVPNLEPQNGAGSKWGEKVASDIRDLIDDMTTHAPVDNRDVRNALRKYKLKEDELSCIQWRQLAAQVKADLVMCGTYSGSGDQKQVSAQFIGVKGGDPFDVPEFTATDEKEAAQKIQKAFADYVNQLRFASICLQYLNSQQWDNALENCNKSLALNPKSTTALYGRAEALMKKAEALESGNGEPTEAAPQSGAPAIDSMATEKTHSPEYIQLMDQALQGYKQVLEVNPIQEDALVAAGYVAAKLDRTDEARQYYSRLLELDPTNETIRLQRALDLAKAGDPEGALQIAREGIDLDSSAVNLQEYAGHFAMAAAAMAEKQDSARADSLYNTALGYYQQVFQAQGDSTDVQVLARMLNTMVKLQQYDQAVQLGRQVVAAKPKEASLWLVYGDALQKAGDIDQALAALDTVIALDPNAPNVYARQGQWLLANGQIARARDAFQKAIDRGELGPDEVSNAIFAYGYNDKYKKNQFDGAMDAFSLAREFAERADLKARANFFMGYILIQQGQQVQKPGTAASAKRALPIFQRSLQLLQNATAYREQAANVQKLIDAAKQYIDVQQALIKRGR